MKIGQSATILEYGCVAAVVVDVIVDACGIQ